MPVRGKFDVDLKELQGKLLELGNFAESALSKSIEALETQNIEMALEIIDEDSNANLMYEDINDFAILLIAKQQPVAIDLRRIIVAIKIAANIERIADFAVNIAKSTIRIGSEPLVKPIVHIKEMHQITLEMLKLSLEAFNDEDIIKAKKLADMDDTVDDLYGQTIRDLMQINLQKPEYLPQILQLSFICRFLERAADHITNIAESILYLVKGRQYDLNK
ncbi:phosphate signaling complex protein PhoU [Cytobacillus dafuensis]|uniref:Phosphate-specific transport system accessory protein PhoU n=1 Tax=Cytobacillus dafuensis TaxID=1742359 RepID=A0A5B8Z6Y0_CYTDA|nr:phosphate signaling complex protein PhoU [Cytobacillus dafuensis]QED48641.1 phosphate signaling complex protein PhoU [Cytobacillus dafuensis]